MHELDIPITRKQIAIGNFVGAVTKIYATRYTAYKIRKQVERMQGAPQVAGYGPAAPARPGGRPPAQFVRPPAPPAPKVTPMPKPANGVAPSGPPTDGLIAPSDLLGYHEAADDFPGLG